MAVAVLTDRFSGVDSEMARSIRSRREHLGMTIKDLAEEAQVDRGRLSALESGTSRPRASTVGAILRTLERLERETGLSDAKVTENSDLVEFEVAGNFGVRVVVKGPVRDRAELEESVLRLISRMQQQQPPNPP
jgi:transcriptional regulator with XRE-family HTH domain